METSKTPYAIAKALGRPSKTVMREIKGRAVASDKGAVGRVSNRCARRADCTRHGVCGDAKRCTLRKRFYRCDAATKNDQDLLHESRRGVNATEEEIAAFDATLHALTKNGQSVHAAMVNNPGLFTVSEKTVYRYIAGGLLRTKDGDLPRKCGLKPSLLGIEPKVRPEILAATEPKSADEGTDRSK